MRRPGWIGLLGVVMVFATVGLADGPALAAFPDLEADCSSDDPDLAIQGCTSLLQNKKQTPFVRALTYARRAYAYAETGNYDAAFDDYTGAIRLDPNNDDHYNNRGRALHKLGEYDLAIGDYDKAISIDPKNAVAYSNRGLAYESMRDYDRALVDYNRALGLDPTDAYTLHDRARLNRSMGRLDAAIVDYTDLLRIDLRDASAFAARGNIHLDRGDYDRAISDLTSAVTIAPDDSSYIGDRAYAYVAKGDYDKAIADYTRQIALEPDSPYGYSGRASAYADKGDYKAAIPDYNKAISIDMASHDYRGRGLAFYYDGDVAKALADFLNSAEVEPRDPYTALWVEIAARRGKTPSRLMSASAKLDMTGWPAPIVRTYLGQMTPAALLAAAENPDPETRKAQVCEVNFYQGEAALLQGNRTDATAMFQAAAKDCPQDFIETFAAKAELKLLGASP